MLVSLAHIGDFAQSSRLQGIFILMAALFVIGLVLEHSLVKHQGFGVRQARPVIAIVASIAVAALVAPLPGLAQASSEPQGLPDLISDPPSIERTRSIRTPQGDVIRVMVFDGYIHNIGTGKLEVSGNPQIADGMEQRIFDGTEWTTVANPTVRFETDDGHNHFHLIRAIDYALWSDDRNEQVTDASKVGFCLVDTEQIEEGYDSNYLISDYNYCGVDDPDATELVMGITPGWRDTYDANVTLQWVDISDTQPGLYWISAHTDPNNEIVESNEENNDLIFSSNRLAVDGYVARDLELQQSNTPIRLKANTYGTVGLRAFVVADGPDNGRLDVPIGVDLLDTDTVRYTPDPGFSGTDAFTYYAHDVTTPFPHAPTRVEVTIEVGTSNDDTVDASDVVEDTKDVSISDLGDQVTAVYEELEVGFELVEPSDEMRPRWHARNLPSGLSIDPESGLVSGIPTFADEFDSTIIATVDGRLIERSVQWSVADQDPPALTPLNNISTSSAELLRLPIGAGTEGASYRGEGLPEGGVVVPNQPMLTGVGREVGSFDVTVQEVIDDEVVNSIEFEWTVRPSTRPAFPI